MRLERLRDPASRSARRASAVASGVVSAVVLVVPTVFVAVPWLYHAVEVLLTR